ncbi:TPA: hypothetical protein ACG0EV_001069 [Streptococcus pyogenes]|uniref:hypothetical protein n=1 Tax=Streptococcus pyogenes TaxID=1314 RepID=UPI00157171B7|nr:hypothetical protein [Streptococcus pyogenes]HEP1683644.1 hypothetical protein [Streptococcus pyogenes]HEP1693804.1 hypothetical protein [Streptococcus pyogenes]HEP1707384.1 hypothetical protein [Streptococcus pyogenes]HEP1727215.1 hypothetical protein [Streptococcus pyogenes]
MKTKSKRFLKLATLCLALLGTTLLMGQPVKAEVTLTQGPSEGLVDNTNSGNNSEQDSIKQEYMTRLGLSQSDIDEEPYYKGRLEGYIAGYQAGLKPEVPENPSGYESSTDGYNDGYTEGYSRSWHKTNQPIRTALYDAFEWFMGWLERFFEGR